MQVSEEVLGTHKERTILGLFDQKVDDLCTEPESCWVQDEVRRLEAKVERRTAQLEALHTIGRTLAATLDLREIYWVMYREIAQGLLGTPHLMVALFDEETEMIHYSFAIVDGEELDQTQLLSIPLGEGPVSDTIRSREPRIIDYREVFNRLQPKGQAVLRGSEKVPQSALFVPMISGDKVAGVMNVQHYEADAFRETDLPLLSILASQATVALANARLYAQEQERADALALALEKQRELDRLRTEILQNVSHELRTPLSLIHGYADLLDSGELGELQPEHQEAVSIIARRVKMLRKLVEDFTTVLDADSTEVPPEPVHLPYLVQMLYDDFQVSGQRAGVTLALEIEAAVPPVFGFAAQLRQVVDNLLTNALKFTSSGGAVTLRLWHQESEVVLEIADTGIGIPHDQLERIFERFYQVDGSATRRHGGVGLGLALVKEIVEGHRGQVTAESKLGEGSTFRIQLPAASQRDRRFPA
jgi:signal transduction histidine kinase